MRCPFCRCDDTLVRDSRVVEDDECVRRRRVCPDCSKRFTTVERVAIPNFQVEKRSGAVKPFDRQKLLHSMYVASRKCSVPEGVLESAVNGIISDLEKSRSPVSTGTIGAMAMSRLRLINKVAYVRYASVYKNFQEVKDFNEFVHQDEIST